MLTRNRLLGQVIGKVVQVIKYCASVVFISLVQKLKLYNISERY